MDYVEAHQEDFEPFMMDESFGTVSGRQQLARPNQARDSSPCTHTHMKTVCCKNEEKARVGRPLGTTSHVSLVQSQHCGASGNQLYTQQQQQ